MDMRLGARPTHPGKKAAAIATEARIAALLNEGKSRADVRAAEGLSKGHFNRLVVMLRCEGRI
jgi:hypothetical protein